MEIPGEASVCQVGVKPEWLLIFTRLLDFTGPPQAIDIGRHPVFVIQSA